jgi:hypothetical protein
LGLLLRLGSLDARLARSKLSPGSVEGRLCDCQVLQPQMVLW